jgi:hypothetical protein
MSKGTKEYVKNEDKTFSGLLGRDYFLVFSGGLLTNAFSEQSSFEDLSEIFAIVLKMK